MCLVGGHGVDLASFPQPFLQPGCQEDLDDFLRPAQLQQHVSSLLVAIARGVDDFLDGLGQGGRGTEVEGAVNSASYLRAAYYSGRSAQRHIFSKWQRRPKRGRIVKLLNEVPDTGEMVEKAASATARMRWIPSKHVIVIASAVAVTAAVVTGVVVHKVKQQAERSMTLPECVQHFSASWDRYRDAIGNRTLDAEIIDKLISDFDAVRQYSEEHGSNKLDLRTEQGKSLVKFVAGYTSKLAEVNNVDLSDLQNQTQEEQQVRDPGNDVVVDLRRNLAVHRKIFGDAA